MAPITPYQEFIAGVLPLAAPSFTTIAENVGRFLVSNGVIEEGATRQQVLTALKDNTSLFERIQRPNEELSQTALRFRACLVGVGWTPLLERMRGRLKYGPTAMHPRSIASFISRQMFEGGLKTFDDAGERSEALLAQIAGLETAPAKVACSHLRELARKIPHAGLGEHAADVWLALIEVLNKKIPQKKRNQNFYHRRLPELVSQTPLGMSAPKVLQALCAGFHHRHLINVARAANRLGWPQISEVLADEARSVWPSAFWIINDLIEEMDDPERRVRLYLKWLPTQEELKTNRYDATDLAKSLANSGLGPRVRKVVEPLITRIKEALKSSDEPLSRLNLLKNTAYGLRVLGMTVESKAFMDRALEELRQVRDPVVRERELMRFDPDTRRRFERTVPSDLSGPKPFSPAEERISRLETAKRALLMVPLLPPREAVPLLENVFEEMEKFPRFEDREFLLKALAKALTSVDWGERTIPLYNRLLFKIAGPRSVRYRVPVSFLELIGKLPGAPLGERRIAVYHLIIEFGGSQSYWPLLKILPSSNLGEEGLTLLERIWSGLADQLKPSYIMSDDIKKAVASLKLGDAAEGFFEKMISQTDDTESLAALIDDSRLSPSARLRLFALIFEKANAAYPLARLGVSLAALSASADASALAREVIAKNGALIARNTSYEGLEVALALEAGTWDEESGKRLAEHKAFAAERQETRDRLKTLRIRTLAVANLKRDKAVIREYLSVLEKVRDPLERALLHGDLGGLIGNLGGWYGKSQRPHLGAFFEMFLEGLPPARHGSFRDEAIAKGADTWDRLPLGYEEKSRLLKKLLAATQGIEPIDRRAAAVLRIADRVSDPIPDPFHPRRSRTLALSTAETAELLKQCLAAAVELPPEHPAASFTIRHIGRHLARHGVESGYPREAFTAEDWEFMEDGAAPYPLG